jgi:hypothetical protein
MLIEDVVCPVENLADMTADLIQLFKDHGYRDASAVGHALEGNLHLVFSQVRFGCTIKWWQLTWQRLYGVNIYSLNGWRRLATHHALSLHNCKHCWPGRTLQFSFAQKEQGTVWLKLYMVAY